MKERSANPPQRLNEFRPGSEITKQGRPAELHGYRDPSHSQPWLSKGMNLLFQPSSPGRREGWADVPKAPSSSPSSRAWCRRALKETQGSPSMKGQWGHWVSCGQHPWDTLLWVSAQAFWEEPPDPGSLCPSSAAWVAPDPFLRALRWQQAPGTG